jgi:hypothetical protein
LVRKRKEVSTMEFAKMLANLNAPTASQTKVASEGNMKQQLANAVEATKTASASSTDAVETLMKTAASLAENEKTAELVHAHMSGRAFAQGAMEVFAAADVAAQKVAAEMTPAGFQMKTAAEQEAMIKAAAEQGYNDTMVKAAAEYNEGYEAALNDAVTVLANEFYKGAQEAEILIQAARSQRNG